MLPAILLRNARGRDRGQAIVEFALVSGVFLFLLAGAFDLGRIFYANITIANAARSGALQAALTPSSQRNANCTTGLDAQNRIVCAVQNETRDSLVSIDRGEITIACEGASTTCSSTPQSGVRSRVTVTATFQLLTPVLRVLFANPTLSLTSSAAADQVDLPAAVLPAPQPPSCTEPTADFTGAPTTGTSPLDVNFTDTTAPGAGCEITAWLWDFGDGTTSTAQNPVHTYTYPGPASNKKFTVTLTVTNTEGSDSLTRNNYITVNQP